MTDIVCGARFCLEFQKNQFYEFVVQYFHMLYVSLSCGL